MINKNKHLMNLAIEQTIKDYNHFNKLARIERWNRFWNKLRCWLKEK